MIDSHVHVYRHSPQFPYAPGQKHPEQDASAEMLIALMRANGIARTSQQPYPYPDAQDLARRVMDAFGARRVMWSTNWPVSVRQLPYSKIVELYRDHLSFATPSERREILSGTVQRVWPFGL